MDCIVAFEVSSPIVEVSSESKPATPTVPRDSISRTAPTPGKIRESGELATGAEDSGGATDDESAVRASRAVLPVKMDAPDGKSKWNCAAARFSLAESAGI